MTTRRQNEIKQWRHIRDTPGQAIFEALDAGLGVESQELSREDCIKHAMEELTLALACPPNGPFNDEHLVKGMAYLHIGYTTWLPLSWSERTENTHHE